MARQEMLFAEAITGIKKALARKDDDSELDSMGEPITNRGNKLKRKAAFTQQGRLNNAENYKRKVTFHGYSRGIISRNPPRLDADGDVVDDDDESDPDLAPAEDDPYGEVRIEQILMPLTHASKLRSHPALSIPYTSKAIDQLIQNAQDILNKEQEALWRLQRLSNEFRGDPGWIPVGDMQADHDILFITQGMPGSQSVPMSRSATLQDTASNEVEMDGVEQNQMTSLPDAAAEAAISLPVEDTEDGIKDELKAEAQPESNDRTTDDTQTNGVDAKEEPTDLQPTTADTLPASDQQTTTAGDSTKVPAEGAEGSTTASAPDISADATQPPTQDATTAESATAPQKQEPQPSAADLNQHEDSTAKSNGTQPPTTTDTTATDQDMPDPIEDTPAAHPMTTRSAARLEAPLPPTPSTSASFPYTPSSPYPTIHPLYALPHLTTTKDFGIPSPEAEETRRLLYAYVQRQEEVVRGVEKLYNGLLRARRRRDEVVEWCDAEGHVGEMSDGEDWVDMERWGLVEELKKGEDVEEEDEAAGKGGKKTRGRKERGG